MKPQLSLVVPVYNEAGNLAPLVRTAAQTLATLGRSHEIILVNDGSTDGTAEEIAACVRFLCIEGGFFTGSPETPLRR